MALKRCVNIDWLEVYCLEDIHETPCNADYFRDRGYFVRERDYGTRQYKEMFVIEDKHGEPWIEIRRNPYTDNKDFKGFVPESTHIRLVNRYCYFDHAVDSLREFLLKHNYVFKRIFRIDICNDFIKFDSGDDPQNFARRYVQMKYRKINQCHLAAFANDEWSDFKWESLKWGNEGSMVSTKLYNKTKEMKKAEKQKNYIKQAWFECGLVDNPLTLMKRDNRGNETYPDIWRVEFSLKSSADSWIVIENQSGKRMKKQSVPHRLSMFDSREKLWDRFEELAYHYFHFKKYIVGQRKDRCPDKVLFNFNLDREFYQVSQVVYDRKPDSTARQLKNSLVRWKEYHLDPKIRKACDAILEAIQRDDVREFKDAKSAVEIEALRRAIALRYGWKPEEIYAIAAEIEKLLKEKSIF